MTNSENVEADMRAQFGDAQTDDHIRTMKATRAFLLVQGAFLSAEVGSAEETLCRERLERMVQDLVSNGTHGAVLSQTLATLVLHMDAGGTIDSFFRTVGLEGPFQQ